MCSVLAIGKLVQKPEESHGEKSTQFSLFRDKIYAEERDANARYQRDVRRIMPLGKLSQIPSYPEANAIRVREAQENFRQIAFFPLDRTAKNRSLEHEILEFENVIISLSEKCNFTMKKVILNMKR